MDCIFCRIVANLIPCKMIDQTPATLTFLDAFPLVPGHTIIIPKKHYSLLQDIPKEENAALFEAVRQASARVAKLAGAALVAIHNGRESGQEIPHVHVHLIPRKAGDGAGPVHSMFSSTAKMTDQQMDDICSKLSDATPRGS